MSPNVRYLPERLPLLGGWADWGDDLGELSRLAHRYVAERWRAGFLNSRSAEQARSRLRDFCAHAPGEPDRLRRHHVERWMERPDLSPQYLRGRLSSVRGFSKWLVANGHIGSDITLTVQAPRVPPQVPKRLTHDQAVALTAAARHDPRTRLVVSLALQEALRVMEISRLQIEHVDYGDRSVLIHGKGGSGHATAVLPISDETWAAYRVYVTGRTGPVIRSKVQPHRGVSPATISELIRQAMIAADVKHGPITPHSTRHTAAHDLLERTSNIRDVQQSLRHSSIRSTEVYLRGQVGDLRRVMAGRSYVA